MPLKYSFYNTREYYDELINALRKSGKGDNIRLASMGLKITAPEVSTIMEELASAAARGAAVAAAIDAYTFLNRDNRLPGPLFFS
jgi:hypothetical protein